METAGVRAGESRVEEAPGLVVCGVGTMDAPKLVAEDMIATASTVEESRWYGDGLLQASMQWQA